MADNQTPAAETVVPVAKIDLARSAVEADAKASVVRRAQATKPVARKAPAAAKPAQVAAKKPTANQTTVRKVAVKKTTPGRGKVSATTANKPALFAQLKDTVMNTAETITEDMTAKAKGAMNEVQDRTKAAFDKGAALMGDMGSFHKDNLEALVEAGKTLGAGLQTLGQDYLADGKNAVETLQSDIKNLAAVRSPSDFFKLQGEIARRNFDAAVAAGSKYSESWVKLTNDTFAPISTRVSVAVEKVKQAA